MTDSVAPTDLKHSTGVERADRPERRPAETPDKRDARQSFLRNEAFMRARKSAPLMLEAQGAALLVIVAALYANSHASAAVAPTRASMLWLTQLQATTVLVAWAAFVAVLLALNALRLLGAHSLLHTSAFSHF